MMDRKGLMSSTDIIKSAAIVTVIISKFFFLTYLVDRAGSMQEINHALWRRCFSTGTFPEFCLVYHTSEVGEHQRRHSGMSTFAVPCPKAYDRLAAPALYRGVITADFIIAMRSCCLNKV